MPASSRVFAREAPGPADAVGSGVRSRLPGRPDRPPSALPALHFAVRRSRVEGPVSFVLGVAFSLLLFVAIVLVQMIGTVQPRDSELIEDIVGFQPPEVEPSIEEMALPEPKEEPPPELAAEQPRLSLDELDLALHPSRGGGLVGDFQAPAFGALGAVREQLADEFVDFGQLDQIPRPVGVAGFNFPPRLLKDKVSGRIVLLLKLDETGKVLHVEVESSNLPAFDDFVVREVSRWRFTPATREGKPVKARARLPLPIRISWHERAVGATGRTV